MHILCTICSDLVGQAENIYVTKCGHVFHYHCLSQWMGRSKTCPQCRCKTTDKSMFRLYLTISNEKTVDDAATLQSRLDDTGLQLRQLKTACTEYEEQLKKLKTELKANEELKKSYEKKLVNRDSAIAAMKDQMLYLKVQNQETCKLKEENEELKKNMQTLTGLQKVLNATSSEVETMLKGYTDVKMIATFATALKRAVCESESKKNQVRIQLENTKHEYDKEKSKVTDLQKRLNSAQEELSDLKGKYEAANSKRKASELIDLKESTPKQLRLSDASDRLNTAILNDSGSSVGSMAQRIENSDSPYLNLKQSNLALVALQRRNVTAPMGATIKPSEYAILNAARNITHRQNENSNTSIFHQKQPLQPEPSERPTKVSLDVSYNGLGGHSKLDTFPVPLQKLRSLVPKLTARHRLKRTPPASQDMSKYLKHIVIDRDLSDT